MVDANDIADSDASSDLDGSIASYDSDGSEISSAIDESDSGHPDDLDDLDEPDGSDDSGDLGLNNLDDFNISVTFDGSNAPNVSAVIHTYDVSLGEIIGLQLGVVSNCRGTEKPCELPGLDLNEEHHGVPKHRPLPTPMTLKGLDSRLRTRGLHLHKA
ncbi:hypothetical protein BCR34DRAFT_654031 [Clohesyomyces aquaticus]|uniref:Uncharacterized protein n=1 Tax=Clohesyomyces aquaticus TaxID=1231657 RepID=A0A1Y1ZKL2_9PLEO|nr:hypothetical protein BCR34DRAFT_654031 [Clohesyomyces aquaticus]